MRNGVNKNNDENHEKKKAKIKCFREVIKVMKFKSLKSDDLKFKEIRHTALSCFSTSVVPLSEVRTCSIRMIHIFHVNKYTRPLRCFVMFLNMAVESELF